MTRRKWLAGTAALAAGLVCPYPALARQQDRQATGGSRQPAADLLGPRAELSIRRGLEFLVARQNQDGSFGTGTHTRNTGIVGLIGLALLAEGSTPNRGPFGRPLARSIDFLLSRAQDNGFIHDPRSRTHGPMYEHGFATLTLAEVFGMTGETDVREPLRRAIRLIVDSQNDRGGWRYEPIRADDDVSVTVCQVMALRAARNAGVHVPSQTIDRAVQYVKRCQNADGGFAYMPGSGRSEFPRSAAALVALYSAGIYDGPEVTAALEYLATFDPRATRADRETHFFYGHYYAVQAKWIAGGEAWRRYFPAIRDVLLERQSSAGQWFDPYGPEYGSAMACFILQTPNDMLPILQR